MHTCTKYMLPGHSGVLSKTLFFFVLRFHSRAKVHILVLQVGYYDRTVCT